MFFTLFFMQPSFRQSRLHQALVYSEENQECSLIKVEERLKAYNCSELHLIVIVREADSQGRDH